MNVTPSIADAVYVEYSAAAWHLGPSMLLTLHSRAPRLTNIFRLHLQRLEATFDDGCLAFRSTLFSSFYICFNFLLLFASLLLLLLCYVSSPSGDVSYILQTILFFTFSHIQQQPHYYCSPRMCSLWYNQSRVSLRVFIFFFLLLNSLGATWRWR